MSVTLPGTGSPVETVNGPNGTDQRQVATIAPRDGTAADSIGGLTEAAPGTDTASAGLNGRLQRIAQRITSLIALLPAALGAGGGLKVDGSGTALPISASDSGIVTLGAKADAKSTATDTTAISAMSVFKQISASMQAAAASLAGTLTVGAATQGFASAVSVTRTADTNAYAANDVLGSAPGSTAAITFANIAGAAGEIMITSVALEIDQAAMISGEGAYRLYLYNIAPPSVLGDNVAWDIAAGDRASFLGYIDLGTPVDLGSTCYVQADGINRQITTLGTSIFGYLTTLGAFTPTSARVHKVTLHSTAI